MFLRSRTALNIWLVLVAALEGCLVSFFRKPFHADALGMASGGLFSLTLTYGWLMFIERMNAKR